jgi:hypothetical protein
MLFCGLLTFEEKGYYVLVVKMNVPKFNLFLRLTEVEWDVVVGYKPFEKAQHLQGSNSPRFFSDCMIFQDGTERVPQTFRDQSQHTPRNIPKKAKTSDLA